MQFVLSSACTDVSTEDPARLKRTRNSEWKSIMVIETYTISAKPLLFSEGQHKRKLKGVSFTAVTATHTREWFMINCGQFERSFTPLMPHAHAKAIVAALLEGEEVKFPGLYREEQFDHGFCYEWSTVHFFVPLSIDPSGRYSVSRPESNQVQAIRRNRLVSA